MAPCEYRPHPKTDKDLKKMPTYRPIALNSHIFTLTKRVVAVRMNHLTPLRCGSLSRSRIVDWSGQFCDLPNIGNEKKFFSIRISSCYFV